MDGHHREQARAPPTTDQQGLVCERLGIVDPASLQRPARSTPADGASPAVARQGVRDAGADGVAAGVGAAEPPPSAAGACGCSEPIEAGTGVAWGWSPIGDTGA